MKVLKKIGPVCLTAALALSLTAPAFASEYTVAKNDSLWKIAKEQLGSGSRWGEIYEANRSAIKDPNQISIGQVLTIPDGQAAPAQAAPAQEAPVQESPVQQVPPQDDTAQPAMPDLSGLPPLPDMGGESDADFPNVSYASNSSAQVMDVFLPEKATGSDPVIVLVHGGGFAFGSQTMEIIRPVIEAGIANGYVVASVDYRKSSESAFPGALSDVKAAVRYLRANAGQYGIDPEKVVIWGESAGAYLSLMTALTPEVDALNGDVSENLGQSTAVTALVDFYGPVEFYTMDDEYRSLGREDTTYSTESSFESKFLGQAIGQDKEKTYATWWATYTDQLPDGFALRAWVQAGDSDSSVPYTQSKNFAAKLAEVIGESNVTFGLIDGAEHEDPLFYTEDNLNQVFDFLADALR